MPPFEKLLQTDYLIDYLFRLRPDPVARLAPLFFGLGVFFAIGLVVGLVRMLRGKRFDEGILRLEIFLCFVGLLSVLARFAGVPFLSTRIFSFGSFVLVMGLLVADRWSRHPPSPWTTLILRSLALQSDPDDGPLPQAISLLLLGLHLVGMGLLLAYYRLPIWLAPLALLFVSFPTLIGWGVARLRKIAIRFRIETLTPLVFAYAVVTLHILLEPTHSIQPELNLVYFSPLNVNAAVLISVVWSWFSQGQALAVQVGRRNLMGIAALSVLLLGMGWTTLIALQDSARGVTASDPYAYVQMAIDLAHRGTPLHRFHLYPLVRPLGIAVWPIVHVGYHPPIDRVGDAPTVWPIGWSVLLAVGYKLIGEPALYLGAAAIALLAFIALWFLGKALLPGSLNERRLASAIAILGLSTSYEQVDRILAPMADAAAELFTILSMLFLWLTLQQETNLRKRLLWAFLTGACFGWAYFIRHTLLSLGIVIVGALALRLRHQPGVLLKVLGLWALGAFLMALPDIFYRWTVFGSPLSPESSELALFTLSNITVTSQQMLSIAVHNFEFGPFIPLIILGIIGLFRSETTGRSVLALLVAWISAVVVVQLPYGPLRIRDLMAAFPAIYLMGGWGAIVLWRWATRTKSIPSWQYLQVILVLFLIFALFTPRIQRLLPWLWQGHQSFGHLTSQQRAEFEKLKLITPAQSVIGCTLNSGAVDLYGERETFRPGYWSAEAFVRFVQDMDENGKPVYLLDDGSGIASTLIFAQQSFGLTPVAKLDVPIFGETSMGKTPTLFRLLHTDDDDVFRPDLDSSMGGFRGKILGTRHCAGPDYQ